MKKILILSLIFFSFAILKAEEGFLSSKDLKEVYSTVQKQRQEVDKKYLSPAFLEKKLTITLNNITSETINYKIIFSDNLWSRKYQSINKGIYGILEELFVIKDFYKLSKEKIESYYIVEKATVADGISQVFMPYQDEWGISVYTDINNQKMTIFRYKYRN